MEQKITIIAVEGHKKWKRKCRIEGQLSAYGSSAYRRRALLGALSKGARFEENHGKLWTATSTSATGVWTWHPPRLPILSVNTPQLVGLMNIWKTAYSVYLYFLYHFLMFTVWKNYPFRLSQFKDNRYCTVYTSFPLQYNFYYSKYFNHKIK